MLNKPGQNAIVFGEEGKAAELVWIEKLPIPATVLLIPHSSYSIPEDIRPQLTLCDEQLTREQLSIVDVYTDELFALPLEQASTVRFSVSRLVVDPERFVEDAGEVMAG